MLSTHINNLKDNRLSVVKELLPFLFPVIKITVGEGRKKVNYSASDDILIMFVQIQTVNMWVNS